MASISTGGTPDQFAASSKVLEACTVVEVVISSVNDAETYVAGPGLLACAWEGTSTTNTGEVGVSITSRATGTVEFDCSAAGRAGTLILFYGNA